MEIWPHEINCNSAGMLGVLYFNTELQGIERGSWIPNPGLCCCPWTAFNIVSDLRVCLASWDERLCLVTQDPVSNSYPFLESICFQMRSCYKLPLLSSPLSSSPGLTIALSSFHWTVKAESIKKSLANIQTLGSQKTFIPKPKDVLHIKHTLVSSKYGFSLPMQIKIWSERGNTNKPTHTHTDVQKQL